MTDDKGHDMRGWHTVIAGAALLGLLLVDPVGAQAAPTLTATPGMVDPGDAVTVTVEGCADPGVGYQIQGQDVFLDLPLTDGGDGTFSGQVVAGRGDLYFFLVEGCDGTDAQTRVDVEDPFLFALPSSDLPLTIRGTDCPVGADPEASITFGGETYVVTDLEVDEVGDWTVDVLSDLPVVPAGPTTVEATCGDVVYEPLALSPPPGSTTTTTTTETVPAPAPAPSANPVPAAARFTG